MKLKPFGSLVLIKIMPEADEKATSTGIIMPATIDQSRTPRMCEVVATGPDVARLPAGTGIMADLANYLDPEIMTIQIIAWTSVIVGAIGLARIVWYKVRKPS